MNPESGRNLSHYRLIEKIGEGGMGVVWKAEDTILGRTVAIKVLQADVSRDEERRKMFLDEARLASSVSEAHIVQVHEFGREGDLDFIVMEYVSGKPLSRVLEGRPLPPERVSEWGAQVARALSRAHRKGLLHRDLKPANILITDDGDAKVVDFGLATLFARADADSGVLSEVETRTSLQSGSGSGTKVAGTLAYMSPEQVRGEELGVHSDIFTLGVVLYEMTTGQRPFVGNNVPDLAGEILKSRPTPVHDLVPRVPLDLERILEKSMAPRPADRYQTMEDLAVDLKRLGRDLETGSSPAYEDLKQVAAATPAPRKSLRWLPIAAVSGIVVAVVLIGAWVLKGTGGAGAAVDAHTILVLPLEIRGQSDSDADYVGRAFAEALAVNLAEIKELRVLPVPEVGEVGSSGALDRARAAQELGAGLLLTGAITRDGDVVHASLKMLDTVENRILWGTSKEAGEGDLASLAASLAREGADKLGFGSTRKLYDAPMNVTGSPAMHDSPELVETLGALRRFELEASLAASERLARAFPDELDAQVLRAEALGRATFFNPNPAVMEPFHEHLRKLERLDPSSPYAEFFRSYGVVRLTLVEEVSKLLRRDDLTPSFRRELLRMRAWALRNTGDPDTAVVDLEAALELDPANARILADLGYILRETDQDRGEEALMRVQQAVALEPTVWFYHHSLGHVYTGLERYEEAAATYGKACELNRFQQPCAARAGSLWDTGRKEEAVAAAQEAAAMDDTVAGTYNLACFHARAGNRDEAMALLHRTVDLGWDSAWMATDPDLKNLHGHPEFEALVARVQEEIDSGGD